MFWAKDKESQGKSHADARWPVNGRKKKVAEGSVYAPILPSFDKYQKGGFASLGKRAISRVSHKLAEPIKPTAEASFHTLNWAAANHDTNAFLNATGLEPQARQRAEDLFAQMPDAIRQRYGSVDA